MFDNKVSQTNKGIYNKSTTKALSSNLSPAIAKNITSDIEKGQIMKGEIIDLRNKEVSVKLDDGRILTGKIEDSSQLSIGNNVTFLVEDVSLKSLTLKIVPNNAYTTLENTIDKALEVAALSKTDRNKSIVSELLKQQMSIDKNTISLLIKQSLLFKDTPINTLVLLNKYQIPVTKSNIEQFHDFQKGGNHLFKQIENFADTATTYFDLPDMPEEEYLNKSSDILKLFMNQSGFYKSSLPGINSENTLNAITKPNDSLVLQETLPKLIEIIKTTPNFSGKETFLNTLQENTLSTSDILNQINKYFSPESEIMLSSEMKEQLTSIKANLSTISNDMNNTVITQNISNLLTTFERSNLMDNLNRFTSNALPTQFADQIVSGQASPDEILHFIESHLETADKESAKELLNSKEFHSLLKESILSKWTLSPENLSKAKDIKEDYETLLKNLNEIKNVAEQSALLNNTETKGQIEHIANRLDFMNQLNQFITYIELPLKFKNQYAGSELYVYSQKKSGRTSKDGVSVLLHLDMKHLGPLDIFLELKEQNLNTKFYLNDKNVEKIIAEHLPLLEKKLSNMGYQVSAQILQREKNLNVIDDFLNQDRNEDSSSRYNFDIRA